MTNRGRKTRRAWAVASPILTALIALVALLATDPGAPLAQTEEGVAEEDAGDALVAQEPIIGIRTDASSWRLLDGEGVSGVMGGGPFLHLGAPDPITETGPEDPARVGYFVIYVDGRGVFEGVYNLKDDGQALVGAFWRDGQSADDVVAGFLDLSSAEEGELFGGVGLITFTDDSAELPVTAR